MTSLTTRTRRMVDETTSSSHFRMNDKKIHTNSFVRKINSLIIRWRVQRCRETLRQSVLLLFICFVLQTCIRGNIFHFANRYSLRTHPRAIHVNEKYEIQFWREYEYRHHREVARLSNVQVKQDDSASSFEEGDCKAMHHWQVENHSTCNPIHEIGAMQEMQHLAKGGFRDVWWIRDGDGSDAVIKTLVWKIKFKQKEKERHQRDANAYAALQSSIFIPNIYGYCVNTAVFDYCEEGTIDDMLEDEDQKFMSTWTPAHVLRYAWQVTKALADVHSSGNIHNSAAISHTDIRSDQFLWMKGMFKLNDFNRARFIRWNDVETKACPFYIEVNKGSHRSPEEYTEDHPLNEQIDVFSLGNVLYSILMRRDVYEDMEKGDVQKVVKDGVFISIPEEVKGQFSDMENVVAVAISMCHVKNVKERKTAMEVERYLREKLEEYGVSKF